MAEFTGKDLRKARDAKDWSRRKLGKEVGVSESTIERWESGESKPTPEDVDRIGEALGDPTIWHKWMLSNHDSYRRRYSDWNDASLPAAALQCRIASENLASLQGMVDRDVVDGRFDDAQLKAKLKAALNAAIAANTEMLSKL